MKCGRLYSITIFCPSPMKCDHLLDWYIFSIAWCYKRSIVTDEASQMSGITSVQGQMIA